MRRGAREGADKSQAKDNDMVTRKSKEPTPQPHAVLVGFTDLSTLWEGSTPIFPSEHAAKWAIRDPRLRPKLVANRAVAFVGHSRVVHLERFARAYEDYCFERFECQ
jgi:hypothetical protein